MNTSKGKIPFYPGQPVPVELFVGRQTQIARIMQRGAAQVAEGKPCAVFVQGEYGIGKSSMAAYVQGLSANKCGLHPIYATLGGARDLPSMAVAVLQATVQSKGADPGALDALRKWLGQYIKSVSFFGIELNVDGIRDDAPRLTTPSAMLRFLQEMHRRLAEVGVRGVFLVLDEINGITRKEEFAHFLKGLVDGNALSGRFLFFSCSAAWRSAGGR